MIKTIGSFNELRTGYAAVRSPSGVDKDAAMMVCSHCFGNVWNIYVIDKQLYLECQEQDCQRQYTGVIRGLL